MTSIISFEPLENALTSLKSALVPPPKNDRERDGAIQRFGYTFELAWKLAKRVLAKNGIDSASPKAVIRGSINFATKQAVDGMQDRFGLKQKQIQFIHECIKKH